MKQSQNNNLDTRISNLRQQVMKNAITLKNKIKNGTVFKFKKFSKKQKQVLTWWNDKSKVKDKVGIITDGSIRSGKTLCMSLSFVMWAMFRYNGQNFILAGKTVRSIQKECSFLVKTNAKGPRI